MTDTPHTSPATPRPRYRSEAGGPHDVPGDPAWQAGYEHGHAAGVAAERQRIRQLATDVHARWHDPEMGHGRWFADLLDGGDS